MKKFTYALIATSFLASTAMAGKGVKYDSDSEGKTRRIYAPRIGPVMGNQTFVQNGVRQRFAMQADMTIPTSRQMGIFQSRIKGTKTWSKPIHFMIEPDWHYWGFVEVLLPRGKDIEYRMGYSLRPWGESLAGCDLKWKREGYYIDGDEDEERIFGAEFHTPAPNEKVVHMVGSCDYAMYPYQKFLEEIEGIGKNIVSIFDGGTSTSESDGDLEPLSEQDTPTAGKVFAMMVERAKTVTYAAAFWEGDQIYADSTRSVARAKTEAMFDFIYRLLWKAKYKRNFMASHPMVFALDDHELTDNATKEMSFGVKGANIAFAYMRHFQLYHTAFLDLETGRQSPGFWYRTETGGIPSFVMDTRFERGGKGKARRMMTKIQMGALKSALLDHKNRMSQPETPFRPFILSGSVPMGMPYNPEDKKVRNYRKDKWSGFPVELAEVLDFIYENKIEGVVAYNGDVHWSAGCQITAEDGTILVTQVTASPFDWPTVYANFESNNVVMNGDLMTERDRKKVNGKREEGNEVQRFKTTNSMEPLVSNAFGEVEYSGDFRFLTFRIIIPDDENPAGRVALQRMYSLTGKVDLDDTDD